MPALRPVLDSKGTFASFAATHEQLMAQQQHYGRSSPGQSVQPHLLGGPDKYGDSIADCTARKLWLLRLFFLLPSQATVSEDMHSKYLHVCTEVTSTHLSTCNAQPCDLPTYSRAFLSRFQSCV